MSDRGYRVLWSVLGLALALIGGAGIAASFGVVPGVDPSTPVLWTGLLSWWRGLGGWAPLVTIGVGLLVALVGAGLLRRQLLPRTDPAGDDLTVYDGADGRTVVHSDVLTDGLERDLERDPRIRDADVELHGTAPEPGLEIKLRLAGGAAPRSVQEHVREAVDRFRRTSGLWPARIDVTVNLDAQELARIL